VRRSLVVVALTAALAALPATAGASLPEAGTFAKSVDLKSIPGSVPYGTGHAVPLKSAKPSWLTFDQQQELARQGSGGTTAYSGPDAPLPGEVGIRPGSWEIDPYGCTMNFIFQNGSSYAIGTAGHCVDKIGQNVTLVTLAPGGANPVLVQIGPVIARHENGIGDDFALVAIPSTLNSWVFPTEAVVGGPCGLYSGFGPETVEHYGHGLAIGTGGTPRVGVALTWQTDAYGWDGEAIFGDSGSAVRTTTFPAAGDLTHLVVDTKWLPSFIAGTRIQKMLQIAGSGWQLVNSPLCP
jgi:hypothetical protein